MRPYACYPGSRARFHPMMSNVRAPFFQQTSSVSAKESSPLANILRKEGLFEIQLAVPGFTKDQIKIEVNEDQLIVTATNNNQEAEKPNFLRQEFSNTGFRRIFKLHRNANSSALKASFDQGILTIAIPDKEPETIKIDIQ